MASVMYQRRRVASPNSAMFRLPRWNIIMAHDGGSNKSQSWKDSGPCDCCSCCWCSGCYCMQMLLSQIQYLENSWLLRLLLSFLLLVPPPKCCCCGCCGPAMSGPERHAKQAGDLYLTA